MQYAQQTKQTTTGQIMLNLQQIKEALQDRRLDIVSEFTGIHRNTIAAIRSGKAANPSYETIAKLSEYLQRGAVQ